MRQSSSVGEERTGWARSAMFKNYRHTRDSAAPPPGAAPTAHRAAARLHL
ncbi:hypothetical protein WME76_42355 [Sorangium sp. So ce119]